MPKPINSSIPDMPKLVTHTESVEELLRNVNVRKANDLDEISSYLHAVYR